MNKYPLIETMGLKIESDGLKHFINPKDLEKALQDAYVVIGSETNGWYSDKGLVGTHYARLVCIQPMKKKTKAEAAIELLKELNGNNSLTVKCWEHQIKDILEMPE